jgi:hypothetical protein
MFRFAAQDSVISQGKSTLARAVANVTEIVILGAQPKSKGKRGVMNNLAELTEADFRDNPVLFVELAREWAAGGPEPTKEHTEWLRKLPRPLIAIPASARDALWGVLSYPERARSLSWLDRAGILEELLPAWSGDYFRQALRLQAVEEVHLERWSVGLSKSSFEWLCVYQDEKADGRLGGWALTGLATLLLAGDEPAPSFAARVQRDLKALGASDGERERVLTAIREFPDLFDAMMTCTLPARNFSPTTVVAALSTLLVMPQIDVVTCQQAMACGEKLLARFAAPEEPTVHSKSKRHS